ncbi:protease B nonderepressible form [Ascosphaera aggregata]|nr:protease B nonderepressible form [Ascosphaera aggregata]
MKRRLTFFHEGGAAFDPQQLSLSPSSLTIRDLDAARQERFTFDIGELSDDDDLRELLEQCNELHIRWASQSYHDAIGPFSSRLAPGLHVHYSSQIESADSLDLDYDSSSTAVKITSFWSKPYTESGLWTEEIESKQHGASRSEVGVLALQQATQAQKLSVGGFLAKIGEDEELNTATYRVHLQQPTGLHPNLQITLPPESLIPPEPTCSLHTYLTLPSAIFADQYQLGTADNIYLCSHNLKSLKYASGELDLEAPDWTVEKWGSSLLLELATREGCQPNDDSNDGNRDADDMRVTIPLHLRYLRPAPNGYRNISIPWPVVFWACSSPAERFSPFERQHLGYDLLFHPNTLFYHLHPSRVIAEDIDDDTAGAGISDVEGHASTTTLIERIRVPVLSIDDNSGYLQQARSIELATVVTILAGLIWVLHKLRLVFPSSAVEWNQKDAPAIEEDKKTS